MKSELFIGVDPGKAGALAVLESDEPYSGRPDEVTILEVRPIPMIPTAKLPKGAKRKPGEREQYDIVAIAEWFKRYRPPTCRLVTIERSQPLPTLRMKSKQAGSVDTPMGGSLANFNRGVQRGFEWLLTALEIPFQLVPPRTWQKIMHTGEEGDLRALEMKQRSINAALRLFPGVDLRRTPRCSTAHDGKAEALLLAEYGRRTTERGTK